MLEKGNNYGTHSLMGGGERIQLCLFRCQVLPRPKKNVVLGFKICPKKNDVLLNLACVHVHVGMQQSINT
jgi:hypothetical protein